MFIWVQALSVDMAALFNIADANDEARVRDRHQARSARALQPDTAGIYRYNPVSVVFYLSYCLCFCI